MAIKGQRCPPTLDAQGELLDGQRVAADNLASLRNAQDESFERAEKGIEGLGLKSREAFEALRSDTEALGEKQRSLLGGLDRLLNLQGSLLGEFIDVKSVIFFTCSVFLTLALTATPRTSNARLPIFLLLTANTLLEKLVATSEQHTH